jgi:hypothetical protein
MLKDGWRFYWIARSEGAIAQMPTLNPSRKASSSLGLTLQSILNMKLDEGGELRLFYRPSFRKLTGSTNAAILLSQIWHFFERKQYKPFYKFIQPCSHELYKAGDSWTELMAWSYEEFRTALKKIGQKVTGGKSKRAIYRDAIVIYWTDSNQMTWFDMNLLNFAKAILSAYDMDALGNSALSVCLKTLDTQLVQELGYSKLPHSIDSFSQKEKTKYLTAADASGEESPSAMDNLEEITRELDPGLAIETIEQHPMVKYFKSKTGTGVLTAKMRKAFLSPVWARHPDNQSHLPYPNLLWHWDHEPEFMSFVKERITELRASSCYYEPINILKNLTKFDAVVTEEWGKKCGWWAWKEANAQLCSSSEPEGNTRVPTYREDEQVYVEYADP